VKTIGSALAFSGSNGLVIDGNLNNATASGFVYGSRFIDSVVSGTAGTHDGVFVRTQDDTTLNSGQVVRGLEVQAWSGSNTNGTNIGIDAYGKTYGISGTIDASAAGVSVPAAVFAYLQNTGATSTGNAIRAYSDKATGATLVSVFQETSAFTGTGLMLDIGNTGTGGGSFASGNFVSLKNAGSQKFHIASTGVVSATFTSTGTKALCHASAGAATDEAITDCSGTPAADYAEMYPMDAGITYGDVVTLGTRMLLPTDGGLDIKQLVNSTKAYDDNVVGIVSNNTGDFTSAGYNINDVDNPMPVALNGRVPVKFSDENGTVVPGDFLTTSATVPGAAMKATQSGRIIGQVISDIVDGQVMTFVENTYHQAEGLTLNGQANFNGTVTFNDAVQLLSHQYSTTTLPALQLLKQGTREYE